MEKFPENSIDSLESVPEIKETRILEMESLISAESSFAEEDKMLKGWRFVLPEADGAILSTRLMRSGGEYKIFFEIWDGQGEIDEAPNVDVVGKSGLKIGSLSKDSGFNIESTQIKDGFWVEKNGKRLNLVPKS